MKNKNYPLYDVERITSIRGLLEYRAKESPDVAAFRYHGKGTEICEVSYRDLNEQVSALGNALLQMGCRGEKIALMGENSYAWLLAWFSVVCSENVVVPLDKELPAEKLTELLNDCGASVLIYSKTYEDVAESVETQLKSKGCELTLLCMTQLEELTEKGRKQLNEGISEYISLKTDPKKTAVIVYTSGTTGQSKGVMLSQESIALDTYSACSTIQFTGDTLLVLPLHHMFGLMAGVLTILLYGHTVFINKSLRKLSEDLLLAKPTDLFLVPLFVETLYKNIWKKAASQGKDKLLKRMIKISRVLLRLGIDIRRKLFRSVLDGFGGNVEVVVSGGAPLNDTYLQGFRDFGMELLNGYGITECSPVIAVNRNQYYRDGSVGQILHECEVRIDNADGGKDGEICVRGPIVMQGYYHMEEETNEVLKDGWFHTGDLGHVDEDGFLFVTGRKKNLIILENGENVSPEELEAKILQIPLVREVVVFDDNRKITAEIFADVEGAKQQGLNTDEMEANIRMGIEQVNRSLPTFMRIGSVRFRKEEFEKNTTKKILRYKVKGA